MAPIVKEVTTQAEFSAAIDCFWDSNYDPYTSFMNILFPISVATEEGYAKAVAESKVRLWSYHEQDPTSHWIYVTDDEDTKEVVYSGAHWNFHETSSPYKDSAPELVALWYPEGVGRDFASRVLNQIYRFRGEQLDYMFTYTNQRNKGYGSMLMQWGMERAERMGVEVVVESSEMGYSLYKKFGLRSIEKIAVDMRVENPTNTWRRLESDFGPVLIWWMWKPRDGIYVAGKTELPWVAKRPA
ncbi:hypothetical protein BGAL_0432g00020 [Botrytis galanthina]|uniref:N-acetyltransferase domain-containing protein n=1 Tax=Botrytis galanthina TaxID=278940 RepID=A0A4S8QRK3_9HELO|nr:hypothetical protein BGAL_0432g00020 [Botrytis galanthina]